MKPEKVYLWIVVLWNVCIYVLHTYFQVHCFPTRDCQEHLLFYLLCAISTCPSQPEFSRIILYNKIIKCWKMQVHQYIHDKFHQIPFIINVIYICKPQNLHLKSKGFHFYSAYRQIERKDKRIPWTVKPGRLQSMGSQSLTRRSD